MLTNHIVYVEAGTYNGICWTGDFRTKISAHNYYSDDDVSAHSNSDSDILETVEKADFVEFLDDDSSTLAGSSEGDLDT